MTTKFDNFIGSRNFPEYFSKISDSSSDKARTGEIYFDYKCIIIIIMSRW